MNKGKICVSVCAESIDELINNIERGSEFADIIELRFDCLSKREFDREDDLRKLKEFKRLCDQKTITPWIATFRAKEQGGIRNLSLIERRDFWNNGLQTDFVDLEEDIIGEKFQLSAKARICSHHDFKGVPDDLDEIYQRLAKTDADIIKIAVTANDITGAIPVWKLLEKAREKKTKMIAIAMGEAGKWTRILGLAHGGFLTYAALESGDETAPGQINARDLQEVYRVKDLDRETKVFGVIGDPVSQSLSTFMHNSAYALTDTNAVFIPLLVKNIEEFVRRMVRPETREIDLNFGGFSVTMPHKRSIMKHLDMIDPTAEKIGAVNTVKIENNKLIGYNTDAEGFVTPLKKVFNDLAGMKIAVCGAGGAARACVYALKKEKADVTIFARDPIKYEDFGVEFEVNIEPLDNAQLNGIDIVVDTTPLGMKGPFENESLFTAEQLTGVKFVYDIVTKSADTPIIREAKKVGVAAIGGVEMLVAQGAIQFEIWMGQIAPVERMRESVMARFEQMKK